LYRRANNFINAICLASVVLSLDSWSLFWFRNPLIMVGERLAKFLQGAGCRWATSWCTWGGEEQYQTSLFKECEQRGVGGCVRICVCVCVCVRVYVWVCVSMYFSVIQHFIVL